jgi:hypothetical protein
MGEIDNYGIVVITHFWSLFYDLLTNKYVEQQNYKKKKSNKKETKSVFLL